MKCFDSIVRCLPACLFVVAIAGPLQADNWPQWRGPANDGVSKEKDIPTRWSDTENIAWKLALPGRGGSTPAIWGDHIFLTSQDGVDLLALCASTDGKLLWKRSLGTSHRKPIRGDEGNDASPSPSTDGKHVYFFDGQGDLVSFDMDGKEQWRFNAQQRYGKFDTWHGWHTTPVLHGGRLYVQLIHSGGAWVVAIDKTNGKEVWKVERKSDSQKESDHSYASPCIWENGKQAYLITHGGDYAIAHSLKDGGEIWRVGDLNPKGDNYNSFFRFVTSPVATPDLIVVPSAKNGPVVGVKPDAKGLLTAGSDGEKWRRAHGTPDVPSPLVHDNLVYLCRENGRLECMEAKTGKEIYSERTHDQRHRASPVYADGKIYLTARDGTSTVVKAGRKFKILATNKLADEIAASPAIANGRIYLRGFNALYAIGSEKK